MLSQQLSFWDNEALETGYRYLADLKLEEAKLHFNRALEAGIGELDSVTKLVAACEYWQARINYLPESNDADSSSEQIDALLIAFVHYPFTPQMSALKKALLAYIVSLLHKEAAMDVKSMTTAFDLLIESDDLQNAENLVLQCINQSTENRLLLYLQAQVQWLSGNRSEASSNYAWLLLHYPDRVEFTRIENKRLHELIHAHGAAMTPAYGWLQNVVPLISPSDEIEICNSEHQKALECYRLLLGANKALLNHDQVLSVQIRKQLKALAPDFFAGYFNWLQRQR